MNGLEKTDPATIPPVVALPTSIIVCAIAVMAISVLAIVTTWLAMSQHVGDPLVHGLASESMLRGGIAYKDDVQQVRRDTEKTISERKIVVDAQIRVAYLATRRMLLTMKLRCKGSGSYMNCEIEHLPESDY